MRQRTLRLTFFVLATLVFTGLVSAQPRPASSLPASRLGVLSGLAAYVPSDALFYASARSDADSIAALNDVAADVTANLPDVMPPAPLEGLIGDLLGVPFSEIDPWLGDGIAVAGILTHNPPYVTVEGPYIDQPDTVEMSYILHVTDADAAEIFLRSRGITAIGVYNDVLVFNDSDDFEQSDISGTPTLLDEPAFVAAIESFESRNYAGIVYADLPLLMAKQRGDDMRRYGSYYGGQQQTFEMAVLLRMFGPVAAGFTRGADGDLLMDVVVTAGNLNGIRPLGLNIQPPVPADPALLAVVPDDAFMVTQGSNLSGGLVELYRAFGPMLKDSWTRSILQSSYLLGYGASSPYELVQDMDVFTLADMVLANALGVTLSDLQNWSSDDYVVFSRLNPDWPPQDGSRYVMPVEAAGVFRVGRPEQSFAAFENLARTLQLWAAGSGEDHIDVRIERQEAQRAVFVTFYLDGREKPGTTIALYVTGDYAILGARGAAEAALARLGTTETAAWLAEAAANFQPDSAFNGVFDPSALVHALPALMGSGFADDVRPYIATLNSLAFDLRVASNGATVMRFTIGLNDAGGIETALGRPTLVPPPPQILPTIYMLPTPTPLFMPMPTLVPPPESTVEVDPILLAMTATASQNILLTATAIAPLPEATVESIPETAMLTATWDAAFTQTAIAPTPTPIATATDFPLMPVIAEQWGIPSFRAADGAFVLGSPDAPTTLVVFSDWVCPHCQNLAPVIDEFIASDVMSGAVNLEHRTLITAGGDATRIAASLAECVDNQKPGTFWSAYPALFGIARETPNVYNDPATLSRTLSTMFNVEPLGSCHFTAMQINTDELYAAEIGANYTPFVAVRNADGTLTVVTDRTLEGIREAVYGGQNAMPLEMTPTPTPDTAEATRAAELANAAATQAAAGQPTATATP
jgi:protein-disulfide isomerase